MVTKSCQNIAPDASIRSYSKFRIGLDLTSESRRFAGGVAQVQNLDESFVFADLVINQDRTMRELTHAGALANGDTYARESREQLHVIEQGIAKMLRSIRILFGDVADYFLEVLQCFLGEKESEIHLGRSSLTFSIGTVRPDLASRKPSSIAARVASSSSTAGTSLANSFSFDLLIAPCYL